jgi:hypothetical protein
MLLNQSNDQVHLLLPVGDKAYVLSTSNQRKDPTKHANTNPEMSTVVRSLPLLLPKPAVAVQDSQRGNAVSTSHFGESELQETTRPPATFNGTTKMGSGIIVTECKVIKCITSAATDEKKNLEAKNVKTVVSKQASTKKRRTSTKNISGDAFQASKIRNAAAGTSNVKIPDRKQPTPVQVCRMTNQLPSTITFKWSKSDSIWRVAKDENGAEPGANQPETHQTQVGNHGNGASSGILVKTDPNVCRQFRLKIEKALDSNGKSRITIKTEKTTTQDNEVIQKKESSTSAAIEVMIKPETNGEDRGNKYAKHARPHKIVGMKSEPDVEVVHHGTTGDQKGDKLSPSPMTSQSSVEINGRVNKEKSTSEGATEKLPKNQSESAECEHTSPELKDAGVLCIEDGTDRHDGSEGSSCAKRETEILCDVHGTSPFETMDSSTSYMDPDSPKTIEERENKIQRLKALLKCTEEKLSMARQKP